MRRLRFRLFALLALSVTTIGLGQLPAGAGVPTITVTVTQDRDHGLVATDAVTITAEARDGNGSPEPDGTLVQFRDTSPSSGGGLPLTDHITVGLAVHGSGVGDGCYWMLGLSGEVLNFGAAPVLGDASGTTTKGSFIDIASNSTGYLLVTDAGEVYPFGLPFHGDARNLSLAHPIISASVLSDGSGNRLFDEQGSVFNYGAATFLGSAGASGITAVATAQTASGLGYWILADNGDVFAFGDAVDAGGGSAADDFVSIVLHGADGYWLVDGAGVPHPFGTASALAAGSGLNDPFLLGRLPIRTAVASADLTGIYVIDALGRLATRGAAVSLGSLWTVPTTGGRATFTFTSLAVGTTTIATSTTAVANGPSLSQTWTAARGYRLVAGDGGIFSFGDTPFLGSMGAIHLNQPIVGMAAS